MPASPTGQVDATTAANNMPDIAGSFDDLANETVFVSGGASGIGAVIVAALAGQGVRVHFCDIDAEAGENLATSLSPHSLHDPVFSACDVTDLAALQTAIDGAAAATGTLYALVNNAANDTRMAVEAVDPAAWDKTVNVNLRHQFFAAQAAFPHLRTRAGAVVNFGSIAPGMGEAGLSVYGTCKAAVFGLTRTLAREFGEAGVRVNSVVPGAILTPRQLDLWITPEKEQRDHRHGSA